MPALFTALFITTFTIASLLSTVELKAYLNHPVTWNYIIKNLYFDTVYQLPGVFENNPLKGVVNGSLWTIHFEVKAYASLLLIYIFGLLDKKLILIALAIITLDMCSVNKLIFTDVGAPMYLALDFTIGVAFALWKDEFKIKFKTILALIILFYFILFVSGMNFIKKIKLRHDISYGVYLYGFFIAQLLVHNFPNNEFRWHQFTSILVSLIIGFMSAILIEKPMMKIYSYLMCQK